MPDHFGHIAKDYDTDFSLTKTGKAQRNKVWRYWKQDIPKKSNILELNCGTGIDALHLAQNKHQVLATDLSPKMVEITAKRCQEMKNVRSQTMDARNINKLEEAFRWTVSNFGGLNCLNAQELTDVSTHLHQISQKEAGFTAIVMGRKCWWENLYFRWKGKKKEAVRRRSKEAVMAHVDGKMVPTYYYSPKEFASLFKEEWQVKKTRPIGLFIPPSYLDNYVSKRPILFQLLSWLEGFAPGFLANQADHFYITFEKKTKQ